MTARNNPASVEEPVAPLYKFAGYAKRVNRRLKAGQQEYGDLSFSLDPLELVQQIREELEDILGWGFVLDCRLQRIEDALSRLSTEEYDK